MGQNVGMADRIVRIILAVVFIILALLPGKYSVLWFIQAVIALVTGIVGWCGLYTLFGWSTAHAEAKPVKAQAKKTSKKKK